MYQLVVRTEAQYLAFCNTPANADEMAVKPIILLRRTHTPSAAEQTKQPHGKVPFVY